MYSLYAMVVEVIHMFMKGCTTEMPSFTYFEDKFALGGLEKYGFIEN